jgi:hypothetical protein
MRSFLQENVSFQQRSPTPTALPGLLPDPPLPLDDNGVVTEGPLRGGVVRDSPAQDPSTIRPPLDPRFLVRLAPQQNFNL